MAKVSPSQSGVRLPLIAALSIGFGMALRRATLRPVRLMQAAARRISASNLAERIVVRPVSGEMADLARLLNEMIDRLEKSFNHAKRFTADVSHELMTPPVPAKLLVFTAYIFDKSHEAAMALH
jgi:methyl-accepting chemotaxis protein